MASYSEVTIQLNDALRQLQIDTQGLTGQALKDELTAFIGRQSVEAEGKVTMLWAAARPAGSWSCCSRPGRSRRHARA